MLAFKSCAVILSRGLTINTVMTEAQWHYRSIIAAENNFYWKHKAVGLFFISTLNTLPAAGNFFSQIQNNLLNFGGISLLFVTFITSSFISGVICASQMRFHQVQKFILKKINLIYCGDKLLLFYKLCVCVCRTAALRVEPIITWHERRF